VAEINLEALAACERAPRRPPGLPAFPEVVRDVALVVDEAVSWRELEAFVARYQEAEPLRDAGEPPRFLSVYRGKQTGPGKKSVAFSVVYRAPDRSLTDEEVNAAQERFVEALLKKFSAALRQ
jgi:phenylalanyl-tRNA synthetase beta chain